MMGNFSSSIYLSVLLLVFISIYGCNTKFAVQTGYKGDETGVGAEANVGKLTLNDNWAVNGMVGFDSYKKKSDYDTFVKAGVQGRRKSGTNPFWFGGEISYVYDIKIPDKNYTGDNENSNGFILGGLAGSKLPIEKLDMNLFTRVALVQFGEQNEKTSLAESENITIGFWLGLEITLPFFE